MPKATGTQREFYCTKRRGLWGCRPGSPRSYPGTCPAFKVKSSVHQLEVVAAVPLPASLVRFGANGLFLAEADALELIGAYAVLSKPLQSGVGAPFAEGQVVFDGAALVAVPLDLDDPVGMRLDGCGRVRECLYRVRTQI